MNLRVKSMRWAGRVAFPLTFGAEASCRASPSVARAAVAAVRFALTESPAPTMSISPRSGSAVLKACCVRRDAITCAHENTDGRGSRGWIGPVVGPCSGG